MSFLNVQVDTAGLRSLLDRQRKQIPFALKEAVNAVALEAQAAERAHVATAFTNRRPDFLKREAVKVLDGFATKQRPSILLGPSDKADFLRKFETKGVKTPTTVASTAGAAMLAIPVDAKRNKKDIISAKNRPRALLNSKAAQTTAAGTGRVFIVRPGDAVGMGPHLRPGIYQRLGRGPNQTLKLLFKLQPSAGILPRLALHVTVRAAVAKGWGKAASDAVAKALASAR